VGIARADVRTEVAAGRWTTHGIHTVQIGTGPLSAEADRWRAVWESGSGAVLDGASALQAAGLTGYTTGLLQVTVPRANRRHRVAGVRSRRRRVVGPLVGVGVGVGVGVPRVRPEWAALRAAEWARTDREAVLVLCLVVQQRLTHPQRLLAAWQEVKVSRRRRLLHAAVGDICDGARSLGELDVAALCREAGLPEPSRQVVRRGPRWRVYLDVAWEDVGLVLEIDGGHHALALHPVDDALRQNEVTLGNEMVLRIPVLGLRLQAELFLNQVVRAYRMLSDRAA